MINSIERLKAAKKIAKSLSRLARLSLFKAVLERPFLVSVVVFCSGLAAIIIPAVLNLSELLRIGFGCAFLLLLSSFIAGVIQLSKLEKADFLTELEQKQKESSLWRSFFFDSPAACVIRDPQGRIMHVNAAWTAFTRMSGDAAIGKTSEEIFPNDLATLLNEADGRVLRTRRPVTQIVDRRFEDGEKRRVISERYALVTSEGDIRAIASTLCDLTSRAPVIGLVDQELALLRGFIKAAPFSICVKDIDRRYVMLNSQYTEMYGADPAFALGKRAEDILARPTWGTTPQDEKKLLQSGHTQRLVGGRELVDGALNWLSQTRFLVRGENDEPLGIGLISIDITDQKRNEKRLVEYQETLEETVSDRTASLIQSNDELRNALDELRQAHDRLIRSEKLASLGGLVAGMAHEINTPIGVGVTAASHLAETARKFKEEAADGILSRQNLNSFLDQMVDGGDILLRNLDRAAELIGSFKQVAVDSSQSERRAIKLQRHIDDIATSLAPLLRKYKVSVIVECDAELTLSTEPGALSQVFTNLIVNAAIHAFEDEIGRDVMGTSPREESDIAVGREILVRAEESETGFVCISVVDNGTGMTEDVRQRIFDPFFTTKRGSGGAGLGLSIVSNIVEGTLGGYLESKSDLGKGSTFTVMLPPLPEA